MEATAADNILRFGTEAPAILHAFAAILLFLHIAGASVAMIAAAVAASPFDPQLWLTERKARQRDNVTTLRRLAAERADTDQRVAALRTLAERIERSPDPAYRAYQQRLLEFNCALAAQLHNSTNVAQRQKARGKFKGWEEDLRALAAGTPG